MVEISTEKNRLNIPLIYKYLSEESYWGKGIPLSTVETAIDNSLCFGVYLNDEQIGFARVITDMATFSYLADVFILNNFKGLGYSKQLVKTILNHPDLQGLRRWMLGTVDAHTLYEKFGFTALSKPERMMEIVRSNPYQQSNSESGT